MVDNAVTLFGRWVETRLSMWNEQTKRVKYTLDQLLTPPRATGPDYDSEWTLYQNE